MTKEPKPESKLSVIVPKRNNIRLYVETICTNKAAMSLRHPSSTIHETLISVQDPTSFRKIGLKSEFHQPKSSLASHSITTFQIKKRKNITKNLFLGYVLPRRNCNIPTEKFSWAWRELKILQMIFWPIFKNCSLLGVESNAITLYLMKCLFFSRQS